MTDRSKDLVPSKQTVRRIHAADAVWLLLLIAQVGSILNLPVMPSTDGPVHLFYVEVSKSLLNRDQPYLDAFEFKRVKPPYLFHYGVLMGLEHFMSPITADKVLVCAYLVWLAVAFRYLTRALGPGWKFACLLALPFSFNFPLFMGFTNFSLATATAVFLVGFWIRWQDRLSISKALRFTGGFAVLVSMHPVGVLCLDTFIAVHGIRTFVGVFREQQGSLGSRLIGGLYRIRSCALPAVLSAGFAIWVWFLVKAAEPQPPYTLELFHRIKGLLLLSEVFAFRNHVYRAMILLWTAGVVAYAIAGYIRRPSSRCEPVASLLTAAAVFACGYVLLPDFAAGSVHLLARLVLMSVLFVLPLIAATEIGGNVARAILAGSLIVGLATTWQAARTTREAAGQIQPLLDAPLLPRGSRVMIMSAGDQDCPDCRFSPFTYAPFHYLSRSVALPFDPPWMINPINPLVLRGKGLLNPLAADPTELPRQIDFLIVLDDKAEEPGSFTAKLAEKYQFERIPLHLGRFALLAQPGRWQR